MRRKGQGGRGTNHLRHPALRRIWLPAQASAGDPRVVERYKHIPDMVHEHGADILTQLMHRRSYHSFSGEGLDWLMPYGASSGFQEGAITKVMDYDDIQRAIESYWVAAGHVTELRVGIVNRDSAHQYWQKLSRWYHFERWVLWNRWMLRVRFPGQVV